MERTEAMRSQWAEKSSNVGKIFEYMTFSSKWFASILGLCSFRRDCAKPGLRRNKLKTVNIIWMLKKPKPYQTKIPNCSLKAKVKKKFCVDSVFIRKRYFKNIV